MMSAPLAAQAPADSGPDYDHTVAAALSAFSSGEYAHARELFERAHRLNPNARTLRALGLTAVELKHYTQARQELEAAQRDTRDPLTPAQREEVGNMLKWMQDGLVSLQLRIEPANAQAALDGVSMPPDGAVVIEPGEHRLHIAADGYRAVDQALSLEAGSQRALEVVLERIDLSPQPTAADAPGSTEASPPFLQPDATHPQADAAPITSRWWFWTAVGVVVVGGTVTAIALASKGTKAPSGEPVGALRVGPAW